MAWDGRARSGAALDWAVARARSARHDDIVLVEVVGDDHPPGPTVPWHDSALGSAIDDLHAQVVHVRERSGVSIDHEVMVGDELRRLAAFTGPATLLVLGATHRAPRVQPFRAHIVSRLVAISAGPVAVIGTATTSPRRGVVVGVDGSLESDAAVVFGAREAARLRQPLVLLHAYRGPAERDLGMLNELEADSLSWMSGAHTELLAQAERSAREVEPDIDVEQRLARHAVVPSLIATGHQATLLVLGSRAHGRLRGLVPLGTVSTALLAAQPCPIVLIGSSAASNQSTSPSEFSIRTPGEHPRHG